MNSEIGAEYSFQELQRLPEQTVVVLNAEHRPEAVTAWFLRIRADELTFFCGLIKFILVLYHNAGGDIVDGKGRRMHVYRYLGEV